MVGKTSNALFMMETSGRSTLRSRQSCAIESAAGKSGMVVYVIMFSPELDLTDNTTCYLYMSKMNIKFFTIDTENFAKDSPLGKQETRMAFHGNFFQILSFLLLN